jgi:hypothetical protein
MYTIIDNNKIAKNFQHYGQLSFDFKKKIAFFENNLIIATMV